ncbi:50S ribosomal protein L6 [Candidatus Haliotispira prima]|uniref:Large ribosomal subunit protein uL6 n=1 Tax=Candidatus Haliotispira prima TaxID=3034016 RepID=A0ABY8MIB9_9SPIO|nr:50S ribosomal protein L6 [Candidatus Haliotispira prima]
MSRVGSQPVALPLGVSVSVNDNTLVVNGAKGELRQDFRPEVSFEIGKEKVCVKRIDDSKIAKSMHGLYARLLTNMVTGVSGGFQKSLEINGVGYRAELKGGNLLFSLGYSTQIEYEAPEGVQLSAEGNTKVLVSGIDKAVVGKVASEIRGLRPPEPYKGKGVKYADEVIRRKSGKSGKK